MKFRAGNRCFSGILVLVAIITSAFAHSGGPGGPGVENPSSFLYGSDGKQIPGIPPESPESDPLPNEEPEGNGEDDDFEGRFHLAGSSITLPGKDHSASSPEHPQPFPVRRRFLEFCTLKLDC